MNRVPAVVAVMALTACFAFAPPASASIARVRGLGVPADYLQTEAAGMATYLSEVVGAGNRVDIEAGSTDAAFRDHAMGLVLPGLFGKGSGVWAIQLRQSAPSIAQAWVYSPVNSGWGGFDDNLAGEAFDLTWGRRVKEADFAVRMHRSFVSFDDGVEETEGEGAAGRNVLGFAAGAAANWNERLRWEVAAHVQRRSFDQGSAGAANDGSLSYLVACRAFHVTTRALSLVPSLKYWSVDLTSTQNGTGVESPETRSGLQVGIAGNWSLPRGDLLVAGAQFVRNDIELADGDEEDEILSPNVFLALETHPNTWLTLRAGAQNVMFYRWHNTFSGVERTYHQHLFLFSLGASARFDRFTFDATLDPAFLHNPIAQLSGGTQAWYVGSGDVRAGAGSGRVAFPQVSASYYW